MKFCWALEMAREMGRRGVSLRTSRVGKRFMEGCVSTKVFIAPCFVVEHTTDDSKILERMA